MRRVAVRTFRSCQSTVRSRRGLSHLRASRRGTFSCPHASILQTTNQPLITHTGKNAQFLRLASSSSPRSSTFTRPEDVLKGQSPSMNVRRATIAVVSGLVGYGAWYSYTGNSTDTARAVTTDSAPSTAADNAIPTRNILVIGADELQTLTFVGEGPITKTTDDEGRTVVEMLTPEQSTQKLRKMEASYLVNRGRGVLRYDLVQLPSNNPIEDDHAEKIVEVPARANAESGSDWSFWGVFDGHS